MYEDAPLLFWVMAGVSKVLIASGWTMDDAVLLASRLTDSILPTLVAAAMLALGASWSAFNRACLAGCVTVASLTIFSPPAFQMLSEFQKNALGLVWMAAAVWACDRAMRTRRAASWLVLTLILGL